MLPKLRSEGEVELARDVTAIAEAFKEPNEEIRLQASALLAKIGETLMEDNRDLVMEAIGAASRIGAAATPLKPALQRVAASSADRDLSFQAAAALERLGK